MRELDYTKRYNRLLTPEIFALVSQIHEFKGEQTLFIEAHADTLTQLMQVAVIQSTEASNRIEGICTSDERLKKLLQDKTMPQNRDEKEIAGYRDVLATIHESHDYIPVKAATLLQLHRDLYKFSGEAIGGRFKVADNIIQEQDSQGNKFVHFQPLAAWETPEAIDRLCAEYDRALQTEKLDPLLLIPLFVLDFLCIHPFSDGNGRMSRLLTLLLLYRSGYIVGKYISVERVIEKTKDSYYETLKASSQGWHEGENSDLPFVQYFLGVLAASYREFSSRVKVLAASNLSKPERVRELIRTHLGKITKAEILQKCPDISTVTVQRTLLELQNKQEIIKIGGGRYTSYAWNHEKENEA